MLTFKLKTFNKNIASTEKFSIFQSKQSYKNSLLASDVDGLGYGTKPTLFGWIVAILWLV